MHGQLERRHRVGALAALFLLLGGRYKKLYAEASERR